MSNNNKKRLPVAEIYFVADTYNRYPGEKVNLSVLVKVNQTLTDARLTVILPPHLIVDRIIEGQPHNIQPYSENGRNTSVQRLVWVIKGGIKVETPYTYQIKGQVDLRCRAAELVCQATLVASDSRIVAQSIIEIKVDPKGQYLKYLPAFYEQDEFMGRFLMLFESFWKPIDNQVEELHYYFDPGLAPANLLPWLATWLDLEANEAWPEDRFRELMRWAIALHRKRGTKWALQKHLEIYTGQQPIIAEKRLTNFVLGDEAKLSSGIALGPGNSPHTFVVTLYLPPIDMSDETERLRRETIRRRAIESIIDMQKPAHTVYTLNLEQITAE